MRRSEAAVAPGHRTGRGGGPGHHHRHGRRDNREEPIGARDVPTVGAGRRTAAAHGGGYHRLDVRAYYRRQRGDRQDGPSTCCRL